MCGAWTLQENLSKVVAAGRNLGQWLYFDSSQLGLWSGGKTRYQSLRGLGPYALFGFGECREL
jgi:hypothetical protein